MIMFMSQVTVQKTCFELLQSPWEEAFISLVRKARRSLVLASPYIGREACQRVVREKSAGRSAPIVRLVVVTDLSRQNLLSGSTDVGAIHKLAINFPDSEVVFLPSVHAKVYIADEQTAIITSGNMTASGLTRNYEYGIKLNDTLLVKRIRADIVAYAALGTRIDLSRLKLLADASADLRQMHRKAERTINSRLREEFGRRLIAFDDEVIRTRAAGRAPHAIFAEAILYLLKRGVMSTRELHHSIQRIHPDLCDDSIDRVIDGRHFGKKWKHAVRTAQQHLRKSGRIQLVDGTWRLSEK